MGSCTRRHFLLSTCFLQMITIIERQVFDFLGYMWAPIFVNFFHILFIIFGFYGAYHFRIKYIITYLIWNFLWIGWNSFLICFYLNVGILDRDSDLLNLGTGSVSWFEVNGYGCKPTYNTNITSEDPYRPIRPESVDDCLLTYDIVEVVHSGVQCVLAFFGILGAILISYIFLDEDDRLKHVNKKSKHRQSLYSIEFGPSLDTIRSRADTILDYGDDQMHERGGMVGLEGDNGELSPKPMTPRRVKRRSVMHRGTNQRQSTTSRRSSGHSSHKNTLRGGGGGGSGDGAGGGGAGSSGTHSRSSTRSSRRKYHQNPVTKLLDQQQQQQQHTMHIHGHHPKQQFGSFHHKDTSAALTASNLQSLNQENHNNINAVSSSMAAGGSLTKTNNNHYQSFRKNIPPDPIYYNTNAQTAYMQQQQWQQMQQQPPSPVTTLDEPQSPTLTLTPSLGGGHYNPTYQHSTTNLNDGEHVDELYNNRPPSVRSSYSNFHGARPMSSYMNSSSNNTENVFVSLVASNTAQNAVTQQSSVSSATSSFQQLQQQPQQITHESPSTPPLYQQHPLHQHSLSQHSLPPPPPLPDPPYTASQPQPIPFHKRTASRESIRSMAFLNSGPPAYNLNYHTPPDSETTM